MDWDSIVKWLAGPTAAGVGGWIARRRLTRLGSRFGDFFAAHKELAICRSECEEQSESFARRIAVIKQERESQSESFARQISMIVQERDYLKLALATLTASSELVTHVHREGLLTTSPASPSEPSPSPTTSPPSPPAPTTRQERPRTP